MLEILANGKSVAEEAGVVMCERKVVVLDEFQGIGFGWASVNGDLLADGRAGLTNKALASGKFSQSVQRHTLYRATRSSGFSLWNQRLAMGGKHR